MNNKSIKPENNHYWLKRLIWSISSKKSSSPIKFFSNTSSSPGLPALVAKRIKSSKNHKKTDKKYKGMHKNHRRIHKNHKRMHKSH
jgi:hypothetical protein